MEITLFEPAEALERNKGYAVVADAGAAKGVDVSFAGGELVVTSCKSRSSKKFPIPTDEWDFENLDFGD
jgi:hypothetical protein